MKQNERICNVYVCKYSSYSYVRVLYILKEYIDDKNRDFILQKVDTERLMKRNTRGASKYRTKLIVARMK